MPDRSLRLAALLALLPAAPGAAQDALADLLADRHHLPQRFAVDGVAEDDVLNLRAGPSAAEAVVGTLAPGAAGVEVVAVTRDGAWGLVPGPEGGAWASMRFLSPEDPEGALAAVPFPLRCVGTEPFWGAELRADGATYDRMDEGARELRPLGQAVTHDGFVLAYDDGGRVRDFAVMRRICSDGMSERPYGLAVINWDRGAEVWSGCCSLLPR